MATFSNILGQNSGIKGQNNIIKEYYCDACHYKCSKKYSWERHIITAKHLNATLSNGGAKKGNHTGNKFNCEFCNKEYNDRTGLWRHKKKCKDFQNETESKTNNIEGLSDKDLIITLLKQNAELLEIVKNGTNNITNTTNNNNCNNNNKTFNLQVFLNETCKDAMNIMDFVDSIKLQLSDLESVGELGYVKGISNIIVKNLRALDVTQRPVHCSDAKREILYVKDNDVWEKEDPENTKMKKAVKYIAYKNTKLLPLWKQTYPECMQFDSSKNDKYNYMVIEAMGGMGDNEGEKINKIIKQIAKEVVIEK